MYTSTLLGYAIILVLSTLFLDNAQACDFRRNVDCSSVNYQYKECRVPGSQLIDISVLKKYSKSSCNRGISYDVRGDTVWVHHGCRAKFSVCSCQRSTLKDCDSNSYRYAECPVSGASSLSYIMLVSKRSKSKCTLGSSFGITGGSVWVNNGCRAKFRVCY